MIDIAAGGKTPTFSSHEEDADLVIQGQLRERIENFFPHRTAECIEFIRTVEFDRCDGSVGREDDRFVHIADPSTARRV